MKQRKRSVAIIGVVGLIAAVGLSTQVAARSGQDSGERLKEARRPSEVPKVFVRYFNAGDVDDLIAAYYAPRSLLVDKPGSVKTGKARRAYLAGLMAPGPRIKVNLRHTYVSGQTALLILDYTIDTKDPAGKPLEIKGSSTDVARRQSDGSWKVVIDNPSGLD